MKGFQLYDVVESASSLYKESIKIEKLSERNYFFLSCPKYPEENDAVDAIIGKIIQLLRECLLID